MYKHEKPKSFPWGDLVQVLWPIFASAIVMPLQIKVTWNRTLTPLFGAPKLNYKKAYGLMVLIASGARVWRETTNHVDKENTERKSQLEELKFKMSNYK